MGFFAKKYNLTKEQPANSSFLAQLVVALAKSKIFQTEKARPFKLQILGPNWPENCIKLRPEPGP